MQVRHSDHDVTPPLHRKGQITLPQIRTAMGMVEGDLLKASLQRGKVVLTPKFAVDRTGFPDANTDYSPAQRRQIDLRLAGSEADLKKGRIIGLFATADEMIASMKNQLKKRAPTRPHARKPAR